MIKLLRVDHRLLHGQVAFSWSSHIGCDCILIANDNVLLDQLRLTTIKLAKPTGIKLVIKSIEDSIAAIKSGVTDKYKLFIVVESIADAKKIIDEIGINYLNVGGTKSAQNKTKLSNSVYVTTEEKQMLKELIEKNVTVSIQMIPSEKSTDVRKII